MHDCLAVPQGIPTLADAEPGDRVVVHSVLFPHRPTGGRVYPDAGEDLRCTHVLGDCIEFERVDGSRLSIDRANAQRVRVAHVRADADAEWCAR